MNNFNLSFSLDYSGSLLKASIPLEEGQVNTIKLNKEQLKTIYGSPKNYNFNMFYNYLGSYTTLGDYVSLLSFSRNSKILSIDFTKQQLLNDLDMVENPFLRLALIENTSFVHYDYERGGSTDNLYHALKKHAKYDFLLIPGKYRNTVIGTRFESLVNAVHVVYL